MNNTTLILLTSLALMAVGTLMVINFGPLPKSEAAKSTFPSMQIKGIEVVHKGVPFTLNFDQQKVATSALLGAEEVKKSDYPEVKGPFTFDKIIVYRFNASDVEIFPIQYKELNLVFSAPALNKDAYYIELSGGEFQKMINSSFDK